MREARHINSSNDWLINAPKQDIEPFVFGAQAKEALCIIQHAAYSSLRLLVRRYGIGVGVLCCFESSGSDDCRQSSLKCMSECAVDCAKFWLKVGPIKAE